MSLLFVQACTEWNATTDKWAAVLSLLGRLWLQMTSSVQHNSACMRDVLPSVGGPGELPRAFNLWRWNCCGCSLQLLVDLYLPQQHRSWMIHSILNISFRGLKMKFAGFWARAVFLPPSSLQTEASCGFSHLMSAHIIDFLHVLAVGLINRAVFLHNTRTGNILHSAGSPKGLNDL